MRRYIFGRLYTHESARGDLDCPCNVYNNKILRVSQIIWPTVYIQIHPSILFIYFNPLL